MQPTVPINPDTDSNHGYIRDLFLITRHSRGVLLSPTNQFQVLLATFNVYSKYSDYKYFLCLLDFKIDQTRQGSLKCLKNY